MYKKDSLTKAILLTLEKTIDGVAYFNDFVNNPGYWAYGSGKDFDKPLISQALKRLREKGFINTIDDKDTNKIIIKLTEVGRDYLLLSKPDEDIEWDGKWRIVVFDIPENKRLIRDVLRNRLKLWGFKLWQKSVWASKKDATRKFRNLIKELNIEDWVLIFESENTGR